MKAFSEMTLQELLLPEGHPCACGQRHQAGLRRVHIGPEALGSLPDVLRELHIKKPFIFSDRNTRRAAWGYLEPVLLEDGIPFAEYVFDKEHLEPDEQVCGSLVMAFDPSCDGLLAIGSGVLNDVGKVFAHAVRLPQVVVATAPSMDGYASDNASMIRDRVKVSLYNACPQAVIADTRILRDAPERMLQAGLGDMLAKYLSICEWRLSHLVTGEYYCENIAGLVRASLKRIVQEAEGLKVRDGKAVERVMEGLLTSGIAMAYARVSRPASGLEHYFSHIWEMMSLERGNKPELHGIQVGIGTLLTLQIWEKLRKIDPGRDKAESFIKAFDEQTWKATVLRIFGSAGEGILTAAVREGRNDPAAHARRLEQILTHWPQILKIVREELPPYEDVAALMRGLNMPMTPEEIGFSAQDTRDALLGAREIRNKYLTSSLMWDLGLLYGWELPSSVLKE